MRIFLICRVQHNRKIGLFSNLQIAPLWQNQSQPRPKYILNKCGTNFYGFTLQLGLVHHHHRILNKIKTDHRKWLCDRKYVEMGIKNPPSSTQPTVCKNIQTCDLRLLQWIKLGKLQLGYYSLFCKMFFSVKYGLERRMPISTYIKKKHSLLAFFFNYKRPFAIFNFDFIEKCFL